MNYNFLKSNINNGVTSEKIGSSSFEEYILSNENSFILNHNKKSIEKIFNFLNTPDNNVFILNGFMGSGKTAVADFISNFINDKVMVFKNSYQEAINTDDVLLSMFKVFYNWHNEQKIVLPKADTNVFSEKINLYIKSCNNPMLFIFDSFEINMRNKETQNDILDFINYLSRFEKVKILICSRSFRKEDLPFTSGVVSDNLQSIEKEEFFDYLKLNEISGAAYEIDDFYKVSRGHYLLMELSVLIMKILNLSLNSFVNEYKKSTQNFLDFLLYRILSTTSDKYIKQLLFLSVLRHGIEGDFLVFQNIAAVDDIEFLAEKHVLAEKYGKYYIKDYFKNAFIKTVNAESKIKAHEYLINLYEEELPLKPFDRVLFLSRQTMRQEIEYHKDKIAKLHDELIKAGKSKRAETQDINYLSYSKVSGFDGETKSNAIYEKKLKRNARKLRKSNISDSDSRLLNISGKNDALSEKFQKISEVLPEEKPVENLFDEISPVNSIPEGVNDYIEIAEQYIDEYNYSTALLYLKKSLSYTNDDNFKEKEPIIYTMMAQCNNKLQDFDEAAKLYEKVFSIYKQNNNIKNAADILISIARMYTEAYKYDKAKEIYKRIINSSEALPSGIIIRVYYNLADLEENSQNMPMTLNYIKLGLDIANKNNNSALLAEGYYKYAIIFDDMDNLEFAEKFYLRCIQVSNNPDENKYISAAYANLADIAFDENNNAAAKMYYELSIETDKKTNNIDGLYYSYMKLAEIYLSEDLEKHYQALQNALNVAKKFDDTENAVDVYIAIGSYFELKQEYKSAIKSYIMAKTLASDENSRKNTDSKIAKIKTKIGENAFNNFVDEIKKKK